MMCAFWKGGCTNLGGRGCPHQLLQDGGLSTTLTDNFWKCPHRRLIPFIIGDSRSAGGCGQKGCPHRILRVWTKEASMYTRNLSPLKPPFSKRSLLKPLNGKRSLLKPPFGGRGLLRALNGKRSIFRLYKKNFIKKFLKKTHIKAN
jgi:hypothetical protein